MKLHIQYKNYRGEDKQITIEADSLRHGTSKFHKEPQWLLSAVELERNVEREYAVKDISYYDIPDLQVNGPCEGDILYNILRVHLVCSMEEEPIKEVSTIVWGDKTVKVTEADLKRLGTRQAVIFTEETVNELISDEIEKHNKLIKELDTVFEERGAMSFSAFPEIKELLGIKS